MKKLFIFMFIAFSIALFAGQIVYITPKGTKYHSSADCRTLKRSKTVTSIDISQVGNRTPCKVCF